MKSIAVFNNKGGVGKSTLTLLIADFFSSTSVTIRDRQPRVLVVDLDGQNSSATALVGKARVEARQREAATVSDLLTQLVRLKRPPLAAYLIRRQATSTGTRKIPLGDLWTMASDAETTMQLEERYRDRIAIAMTERFLPMLEDEFDFVLFDLPANIDRRNFLAMAALGAADYLLVPTEPSRITLNAMPQTFHIIRDVQGAARQAGRRVPKVIGVVLNKTDRRTKQYRLHARDIVALAGKSGALVFENFLPEAPTLASASDDSLKFETLRERYDTYYDHVRRVAKELAERCGFVRARQAEAARSKR
jgi:chromosome partitioning protein